MDKWHIIPLNDHKEHVGYGLWCHCAPEIRPVGDRTLVIHNAYDAREFFEEDEPEDPLDLRTSGTFVAWNLDNLPIDISDNP